MGENLSHLRAVGKALFSETKDLLDPWLTYAEFKESATRKALFFEVLRRMPMAKVHELVQMFPKKYKETLNHELQLYVIFEKGKFSCKHLWRNFADVKRRCCVNCKKDEPMEDEFEESRI